MGKAPKAPPGAMGARWERDLLGGWARDDVPWDSIILGNMRRSCSGFRSFLFPILFLYYFHTSLLGVYWYY